MALATFRPVNIPFLTLAMYREHYLIFIAGEIPAISFLIDYVV